MVSPILLSISFIAIGVITYLYVKAESKRKDLEAKFKTTVNYAEKISKSLNNLELKNRALQLQVSSLQEKIATKNVIKDAMMTAPQMNGSAIPVTETKSEVKKPRKRGPRRKPNNDNK